MKVFIYITKGKQGLFKDGNSFYLGKDSCWFRDLKGDLHKPLNGLVVASFELNEAENVSEKYAHSHEDRHFHEILEKGCLTPQQLEEYCPTGSKKKAYAWHIDDLEIFDEPFRIAKAPQSWMYSNAVYFTGQCDPCIVLSMRPKWGCKTLNREKTIEFRHTLPKGMRVI